MTYSTIGFRIIFFIDLSIVNIFMTIDTPDPDLPEVPFPGFLMTGEAGCCQVRPFQVKPALIMLVNRVRNLIEGFGVVTIGTICNNTFLHKLTVMIIFMTIGAFQTDLPETPFFSFPVTFNAWG